MGEARAREALLDFLRVTEHVAYKFAAHPDRLDDRGFTYVIGLPVGTEDDAARAVELARALIDALDGISRELSPPLCVAVGLSRGTALVSRTAGGASNAPKFQYELLGQPAQIARRLATEAMPGEILVGGGIFRAARNDWSFEELDAIELPPDGDTAPGAGARSAGDTGARAKVYRLIGPRPRADRLADHAGLRRRVGRDPRAVDAARRASRGRRAEPRALRARARRSRRRQGEHRRRLPPQARSDDAPRPALRRPPDLARQPLRHGLGSHARSLRPARGRRAARGQAAHRIGGRAPVSADGRAGSAPGVRRARRAPRRQGRRLRRARRGRAAPSPLRRHAQAAGAPRRGAHARRRRRGHALGRLAVVRDPDVAGARSDGSPGARRGHRAPRRAHRRARALGAHHRRARR